MATARLVYQTSENLDARTIAHTTPDGRIRQLVTTDDLIVTLGEAQITARGLDLEMRWQTEVEEGMWWLRHANDKLLVAGFEAVNTYSLHGEHLRRFETNLTWKPTHLAFDDVTSDVAILGVEGLEAWAAIFDGATGAKRHEWDMAEDYDFGDWPDVKGVMLHGGRLIIAEGQQISVWIDGELEQLEWRRGKHLGQHTDESWALTGGYVVEVSSDKRGVVLYDAGSLLLVEQPGARGVFVGPLGDDIAVWSDQHITVWNGEQLEFLRPDWRGHYHTSFTPDGEHAISVSVMGEICVQRVADFEELDAEPEPVWAISNVTAFATNPAGTHACVVRGIPNAMARLDVINLAASESCELGKIRPTDKIHFLDDDRGFATTGRWVSPASASSWSVSTADFIGVLRDVLNVSEPQPDISAIEVEGEFLGSGPRWLATKGEDHSVTFWALEADKLEVLDKPDLPDGLELNEVQSRRFATGWTKDYEQVVYDFETRSMFLTDDGVLGGDLYVVNKWSDNEVVVFELPLGEQIARCPNENIDAVIPLQSRRQVFLTTYEGVLLSWEPAAGEPVEVFSAPDLGEVCRSPDDRYLVARGGVVRVFDANAPGEPLLELTSTRPMTRAEISGDYLLVASSHGMYAVYAIEP